MVRTKSARSAQKPHETESLFKFLLHFHPESTEYLRKGGKPWVWYSYDYAEERAAFLPGLDRDARTLFMLLLRRMWKYEDLYLFFRDTYPAWENLGHPSQRLVLHFAAGRGGQIATLSQQYSQYVARQMEQLGVESFTLRAWKSLNPAPGASPSSSTKAFYGIYAFEHNPQIAHWLASGTLLSVKVYDNRRYHDENEYGLIEPPKQPAAAPTVAPVPALGGIVTGLMNHLRPDEAAAPTTQP